MERLDVHELLERAELGSVLARSTSGIMEPIVDGNRAQLVIIDQFVQGVGWIRKRAIPHAPRIGGMQHHVQPPLPQGVRNIAVAVQGRYAGTASRVIAFLLDQFIIETCFILVVRMTQHTVEIVSWKEKGSIDLEDDNHYHFYILILLGIWQFVYYLSALAASGRTIGKVVVGLKVVNNDDGMSVSIGRAALRTLLLPLSIWSIIGVLCGLVRSDRREFHDLVAGTGVIYSWDARLARYREETLEGVEDDIYMGNDSFVTEVEDSAGTKIFSERGRQHRLFSRNKTANSNRTELTERFAGSYQRAGSVLDSEL